MKPLIAIAALAGAVVSLPALAATDSECQDLWKQADTNSDGVLSDGEFGPLRGSDAHRQPHGRRRGQDHAR